MAVEAHMRNGVTGDDTPLKVDPDITSATAVHVPMFGILLVGPAKSDQAIVRLETAKWLALLVQPDDEGRFGPQSNKVEYPCRLVGSTIEIELLPNVSHEERLVVCIDGLPAEGNTDG